MTKNPFLNAFAASGYIVLISSIMTILTKTAPPEDNFMAPIVALSLFTLSAAVMGYIFCYSPIQLYFDGKKKEAVSLFLKTIGFFGGLTALALTLLFLF